jgi:hypothetical protein
MSNFYDPQRPFSTLNEKASFIQSQSGSQVGTPGRVSRIEGNSTQYVPKYI